MTHAFYSYTTRHREDDMWEVVCDQDDTVYGVYDDEETADFMAGEAFCDDGAMIAHEAKTSAV